MQVPRVPHAELTDVKVRICGRAHAWSVIGTGSSRVTTDLINTLLSALAEPTRRQALGLLWQDRELCVCELMSILGVTQSRMSRHMSVLKAAGLVLDRRDAQWVRYRRNPEVPRAITNIVESVLSAMKRRIAPCSVAAVQQRPAREGISVSNTIAFRSGSRSAIRRRADGSAGVAGALLVWALLYSQLVPFSDWAVSLLPVDRKSHLGEAIAFFIYDTPKVLLLLTLVVFAHGRRAQLLLAGEDAGHAGRPARRRRQCPGGRSRHPDAVLLLLRRAAVHRLRERRRAAWRHVLVPHRGAHDQRGGAGAAVRVWSAGRWRSPTSPSGSPSRSSAASSSAS